MARRTKTSLLAAGLVVFLAVASMGSMAATAATTPSPSSSSAETTKDGATTFTFQAEVARLMDILVHSLYSNRDVFLRELVSNASDALDKARVLALRRKAGVSAGAPSPSPSSENDGAASPPAPPPPVADAEAAARNDEELELAVRVWLDPDGKVLNIRDTGVGMTRDELVKNLGTIARSGTSAFLDQLQQQGGEGKDGKKKGKKSSGSGGDASLIGQFGVGFYSAFLVSDWVEVISKSDSDSKAWVWSSAADGGFAVAEEKDVSQRTGAAADKAAAPASSSSPSSAPLARGTWLRLHLKEDARDYASESKLRELVGRYSEFINYPIYLETEKEVDVPIEEQETTSEDGEIGEDASKTKNKKTSGEDDVEDEDDESSSSSSSASAPKTRKEKRHAWAVVNEQKPLWLRPASEVSADEYNSFYKSLSRDWQDPLAHVHFRAEGDLDFRALAFLPKAAPPDFYEKYHEPSSSSRPSVKLYSRRVLVADDLGDSLVPKYLSWAKGVVDSDALPLSVSRETLQASASLRTVRKKLGRKLLDAVKKLADEQQRCLEEKKERSGEEEKKDGDEKKDEGDDKDNKDEGACGRYGAFYSSFGRALKMGVIEDASNRGRLAKLLRFRSSLFPGDDTDSNAPTVSLDDYAARARARAEREGLPAPKHILFVTAPSLKEAKASPFAEAAVSRGHEVLYLTDVLDEYVTQHLTEHDDLALADVARDGTVDWSRLSGSSSEGGKKASSSSPSGDGADASSSSSSSSTESSDAAAKRLKDADKAARKRLKPLTKWWKAVLGPGSVGGVRVSARLPPSTPAAVAAGKHGPSAQMERIMRAQAMGGTAQAQAQAAAARQARFLEINPEHALVRRLEALVGDWSPGAKDGSEGSEEAAAAAASSVPAEARATAMLLYDAALLEGGYLLDDARETTRRVYAMLMKEEEGGKEEAKADEGGASASASDKEEKEEHANDEGVEDEHDEL